MGDNRLDGTTQLMALRLAKTKTGSNQWAEVRRSQVQELVRVLLESTKQGSRLFPFTTSSFRYHFKNACHGLPDYVPHSLRHGGATHDFLVGVGLEEILRRGRWASTASARHYIQAGRALLLTLRVPDGLIKAGNALAKDLPLSLSLAQRH